MTNKILKMEAPQRPGEPQKESLRRTGRIFKGLYSRIVNPVHEVYTPGLACKTLHAEICRDDPSTAATDLKLFMPPQQTLAQKMKNKSQFMEKLPVLVPEGDGNTSFSFQNNYLLLAYYSLIMFRNYQASNFNILFLILSSYIVKHQINSAFSKGLNQLNSVLLENYEK